MAAGKPADVLSHVDKADTAWAEGDRWVYGTWAQLRIGAALAHVMAGEVEGASEEITEVLELPSDYRVVTITGRLGEVNRQLAQPRYVGSRQAASLRDQIDEFKAGSLTNTAAIEAPEPP